MRSAYVVYETYEFASEDRIDLSIEVKGLSAKKEPSSEAVYVDPDVRETGHLVAVIYDTGDSFSLTCGHQDFVVVTTEERAKKAKKALELSVPKFENLIIGFSFVPTFLRVDSLLVPISLIDWIDYFGGFSYAETMQLEVPKAPLATAKPLVPAARIEATEDGLVFVVGPYSVEHPEKIQVGPLGNFVDYVVMNSRLEALVAFRKAGDHVIRVDGNGESFGSCRKRLDAWMGRMVKNRRL